MTKAAAWLILIARFLVAAVRSGLQTLRIVLSPPPGMQPGFVDFEFQPMSVWGATLLGCLITLTPGTTTVDIDMDARRMRLHLLDVRGVDEALADIRRELEAPVRAIFGREASA